MPLLVNTRAAAQTSNPFNNTNPVRRYLLVGQGATLVEAEMLAAPRYARLRRLLLPQVSPRQADVLLVVGPINLRLRKALLRLSRQLAAPSQILEVGSTIGLPDPNQRLYSQTKRLEKFLPYVYTTLQDQWITPIKIAEALQSLPPPTAITIVIDKQATEGPGDLIPLRAAENREMATEDLTLSVGPLHPAVYGPLRLILTLDGEQVVEARADPGYAHRGLEKAAEGHSPAAIVGYGAALDGLAPLAGAVAVAQALEAIMMLPDAANLPKRAIYLRLIGLELERIASHLFATARLLRTLNLNGQAAQLLEERAKVISALEILMQPAENVPFSAYIVAGGVKNDLTSTAFRVLEEVMGSLRYWAEQQFAPPGLAQQVGRYAFESRLKGLGLVNISTALEYSLSGPNLRACGIKLDGRKVITRTNNSNDISSVYQELGFESIVVTGGDAFSRYRQRIAEIAASTGLVKKALKNLPSGPYQYKLELDKLEPPFGIVPAEASSLVESPRGLLEAHLALTLAPGLGLVVERLRLRTPSWSHYSLLPQLLVGERLDDALVVINSLDIAPDEAER